MRQKNALEVIVMDLEGTMSDSRTRGLWTPDMAHDWHLSFSQDPINKEVIKILNSMKYPYIIITAKPECYSDIISHWLQKHKLRPAIDIFMRPQGNLQRAPEVKNLLLNQAKRIYTPVFAMDDREDCCSMFLRNNIPCLQVKYPGIPQTRCLPPEEMHNGRN